jgi:hypothetical protein
MEAFASRRGDVEFWRPYLGEILNQHGLTDSSQELAAGFNASNPTFLQGDLAIKLFGHFPAWPKNYAAERAAHALLATDPEIAAPRLLGSGQLFKDASAGWPYLITTRMPGVPLRSAVLSTELRTSVVAELGRQLRRVHALQPAGVATEADWPAGDVTAAARRSSLPEHLVDQVEDYLTRLGPFDRVFVNSDVVANHVYVEDGRLAGIIDWGDAMLTDRHCELIQLYRDTFQCDKSLFRVFLDAYEWPFDGNFPHQALGHALRRQAIGLIQHHSIDVFEPIAARFPLQEIATLDELAVELFAT